MTRKAEDRVERILSDLLRGRRLRLRVEDADEKVAIITAAGLVSAAQGPQRMRPAFRQRLARALSPEQGWLTRRSALVAGLGLAAGAAAGGLVGASLPGPAQARGGAIDPLHGRWVDVAALVDLVQGEGVRVAAGGVRAYLFRRGDTVTAVSSICSHLPCELDWNAGSGRLDCPCHPASFTADGRSAAYSYPVPPLSTVHVRVTAAGRVEVLGTG